MSQLRNDHQILVGPRCLDDRIYRLIYQPATDDVWAEEWRDGAWIRTTALVRHVLKAPPPKPARLRREGIPPERGDLDGAVAWG